MQSAVLVEGVLYLERHKACLELPPYTSEAIRRHFWRFINIGYVRQFLKLSALMETCIKND